MAVMVGDALGSGGDDAAPDAVVPEALLFDDEVFPLGSAEFQDALPDRWLLATDPASVPGQWADAAMVAAFRADNHGAWLRSRWIWEAARASAGTAARVAERSRPGKIPAASLGWSEQMGSARIEFARQILVRLPALGEAMREGRLEEGKAGIFVSTVADLDDEQARLVVERLLGRAPGWTYGRLRDKVEGEAKAVDPGWAEARKAAAIARRRVTFRAAPSGSTELCGLDLPPEPAQDAYDRIVALSDEVGDRLRSLGRDAPVGPIQTEVMLTLTGPDGAGLWDDDVIELVLSRFTDPGPGPGDGTDPDDGPGPDDCSGPHDGPGPDPDPGPERGPDGGPGPEVGPDPAAGPHRGEDLGPDDGFDEGPGGSPDLGSDDDGSGEAGTAPSPRAVPFRARVAIRLGLRTVLGLDRRPGEIPGHGSVCTSTARSMAWARTETAWRVHLYDDHGALQYLLSVRPPAHGPPAIDGRRRRHVVELTAHTRELDDLAAGIGLDDVGLGGLVGADAITLLSRAGRALAAARARPAHEHPAVTTADAHRRRPGAELARWIQARDLTCRGIGCDRQAVGADLDHTLDWLHGGQSTADDLGAMCESDHQFKHDPRSGWTVEQPHPGTFVWTAPTGRRHTKTPEPYDPPPHPQTPADGSPFTLPADLFAPPPRTPDPFTPRRNRHGDITDAARETADHLAGRHRARQGEPPSRYDHDPDF